LIFAGISQDRQDSLRLQIMEPPKPEQPCDPGEWLEETPTTVRPLPARTLYKMAVQLDEPEPGLTFTEPNAPSRALDI
jgi:hypothetical protein